MLNFILDKSTFLHVHFIYTEKQYIVYKNEWKFGAYYINGTYGGAGGAQLKGTLLVFCMYGGPVGPQ